MSIYNKATLVQIPSGYKATDAKLYSVLPNTADGDFTVSADADATRVNKDGLIESTSANQARLSRNFIDGVVQPDPYLLLEPTRANFIVRSETFNLWGDVGVTVTEDATIAPTGAQTADLLTSTANNWRRSISYTITNGTVYSFSCFVKKHTTTDNIRFELYKGASATFLDFVFSTQALSASDTSLTDLKVENHPNDWYRVSCKFTSNGTLFICYAYPSQGYSIAGSAYFWGAQLEEGSYPTSYIPTSGTAVTRSVDTCGTSDTNLINNIEGVLFVDFEFSEQGTTSLYQIATGLFNSGGSGTQRITIDNYSGKLRIYVVSPSGTITVWDTSKSISNVVANQRYRVAIRYKNGDCASYVNGELYKADSGSMSGFDLVKMVFGYANFGNTLMHRGKIYQAMYFNTSLLNSELEEITSYKSFGQMAKALLYTIE